MLQLRSILLRHSRSLTHCSNSRLIVWPMASTVSIDRPKIPPNFHRSMCSKLSSSSSSSPSNSSPDRSSRSDEETASIAKEEPKEQSPSLYQRFKLLWKQYWYIVLPVHLASSALWFALFYYAAKRWC